MSISPAKHSLTEGCIESVSFRSYNPAGRVELAYKIGGERIKQLRGHGRLLVQPVVDLRAYRVRAVVDWVKVSVSTNERCDHTAIQAVVAPHLGSRPSVAGQNKDEKGKSTDFVVTLQEPKGHLLGKIDTALRWSPLIEAGPTPVAMEVAVDFYAKDKTVVTRQRMVALLQQHFLPTHAAWSHKRGKPRSTVTRYAPKVKVVRNRAGKRVEKRDWSETFRFEDEEEIGHRAFVDGTYYVGPKNGPVSWRIQDKTTDDRKGGRARALPEAEHRARIEVTLTGKAFRDLELFTVSDLMAFKFMTLRKRYFRFFTATLPTWRNDVAPLPALVNRRLREGYWRTFTETGVLGVLRLDEKQAKIRSSANTAKPTAQRRRKANGRLERHQVGRRPWQKMTEEVPHDWDMGQQGYLGAFNELNDRVRHALEDLNLAPKA